MKGPQVLMIGIASSRQFFKYTSFWKGTKQKTNIRTTQTSNLVTKTKVVKLTQVNPFFNIAFIVALCV